jgi:3'-phosphoadenosine 5'-phosphosulfate sulfotransferase (PAPS reductase)/FAD synthetase
MVSAFIYKQMEESYSDKINWTLDQKIFHLLETVDVYYHKFNGGVYLNFSGGKDSTVLKFFIDRWCEMNGYSKIKCLFNNTTNEHKQILDFVKTFGDEVIWTRPRMTFAETLQKYGYPVVSKQTARFIDRYRKTKSEAMKLFYKFGINKDGSKSAFKIAKKWHYLLDEDFLTTDKCCDVLKKEPIKKFEKETGLKPINGVMTSESNQRKMRYLKNGGCISWKEGKEICSPLSLFTEDNIWECIDKFNIEICPIYYDQIIDGELVTGEKRTGCAWCLFGLHCESKDDNRISRLAKREPNRYKSMMDKMGYRKVLEALGFQHLP